MNEVTNATDGQKLTHPNVGYYKQFLEGWNTKECGPKPSNALFATVHLLDPSKRPGVEGLHIAMALRPTGCTVRQFQIAGSCGPANNYRRALANAGLIKVLVEGKPYAYVATVTPKGLKAIAKAQETLAQAEANEKAEAPKAKKAAKASSKGKGTSKRKPAAEVPAPTENASAATPEPTETPPVTEVTDQPVAA